MVGFSVKHVTVHCPVSLMECVCVQIQPSDTICIAFNTVAALVLNKNYTCEYSTGGYYGGFCNCTNVA